MDRQRIRELRAELDAERVSYSELAEIEGIADDLKIEVSEDMTAEDVLNAIEAEMACNDCDLGVTEYPVNEDGTCSWCGRMKA